MTALAKLPEKWRAEADMYEAEHNNQHGYVIEWESHGKAIALERAADELTAALSPAELGGVVTFDVVREVVKARTRLGFASPEGQEEQAARAIELIRELCEEVVSLNSASWVAEVITVTEPGDKGVRIRWRGGFPQVGDKLYTTPRAAAADWLPIESAPKSDICWFWITPKTADETYCNTSGDPITSNAPPRAHLGRKGSWSSLMKATHWKTYDEPAAPPALTPPSAKGE